MRSTEPFTPLLVHSRGSIVEALTARRYALGMTGEDLDAAAGWADRLTGKIEKPHRPAGRPSFHFDYGSEVLPTGDLIATQMADVWLEALGLRLVLVDAETADRIGAVPAPPPVKGRRSKRGGDASSGHGIRRRQRGLLSTMPVAAYEAADRTRVSGMALKAAVAEHPWVASRPHLLERAEAIERQLQGLADDIGDAS